MGLDQYLYAKKYLGLCWAKDKDLSKTISVINKMHDFLSIPRINPTLAVWTILDVYPRVQNIEVLVAQWRKDYSVEGFFDECIKHKENGGYYFVPRSKLKELHDLAEKVMVESENEWQQQDAERTVSMIAPLLTPDWDDFDFYYSSNW